MHRCALCVHVCVLARACTGRPDKDSGCLVYSLEIKSLTKSGAGHHG